MKKISVISLILIFIFAFSGCAVLDSSFFYDEAENTENPKIYVNDLLDKCFVGQYNCTEYTENMEIAIPDYWEGIPVTTFGGYLGKGLPTPFIIDLSDIYMNTEDNMVWSFDSINSKSVGTDYEIKELEFVLKIGEHISEIRNVEMDYYYPHINDDGSITFYHPVVRIECAENNKHFYSKDGKLYDKKTDELIEDFAYKN